VIKDFSFVVNRMSWEY